MWELTLQQSHLLSQQINNSNRLYTGTSSEVSFFYALKSIFQTHGMNGKSIHQSRPIYAIYTGLIKDFLDSFGVHITNWNYRNQKRLCHHLEFETRQHETFGLLEGHICYGEFSLQEKIQRCAPSSKTSFHVSTAAKIPGRNQPLSRDAAKKITSSSPALHLLQFLTIRCQLRESKKI